MLTAAPSLDTRVGTTLAGKYRLERLIAVGGMASVYQAQHRNGNRVAVKILHPEVAINSNSAVGFCAKVASPTASIIPARHVFSTTI